MILINYNIKGEVVYIDYLIIVNNFKYLFVLLYVKKFLNKKVKIIFFGGVWGCLIM